jgi:hypothetical protein
MVKDTHNDIYQISDEDKTIWRYMNFWKFEDLIKYKRLYFSSVADFTDKHEFKIPEFVIEKFEKIGDIVYVNHLNEINNYAEKKAKNYGVQCWSISKHESYALWKIYTNSEPDSVAVKTKIIKLKEVFSENDCWQYMGKLNYFSDEIDYKLMGNMHNILMNKHIYYQFENELRVVNIVPGDLKTTTSLNHVEINPNLLIEEIYISPFSNDETINKIKSFLAENKINKNVIKSGISEKFS